MNVMLLTLTEYGDFPSYYVLPESLGKFITDYKPPSREQLNWKVDIPDRVIQDIKQTYGLLHDHEHEDYDIKLEATIGSYKNDLMITSAMAFNFKIFSSVMEVSEYAKNNNLNIVGEMNGLFY